MYYRMLLQNKWYALPIRMGADSADSYINGYGALDAALSVNECIAYTKNLSAFADMVGVYRTDIEIIGDEKPFVEAGEHIKAGGYIKAGDYIGESAAPHPLHWFAKLHQRKKGKS